MTPFFCKAPMTRSGQGHKKMAPGTKVKPQATLSFMPGRPPILDPSPPKPQHPTSWPGQMWHHLTNMLRSPPPVYWVNQQILSGCSPPSVPQYPVMPCPVVDHGGGLWHHAPPGGMQEQMMMDPQQMLQAYTVFHSKMQGPVYPSGCPPTKPLNPNAQEWVPREYRKDPAMPRTPTNGWVEEKVSPHDPLQIPIIPNGYQDFYEITEKEVEDVRLNGCLPPKDVPVTSVTNSYGHCQVPASRWPPDTKRDQIEVITIVPGTEESEGKSTSQTCLESTLASERKVDSPLQSSQAPSPPSILENSESPAAVSEENESVSRSCVSVCDEVRKSASPEQASQSQEPCCFWANSANTTPGCLNCKKSDRPSTKAASPGSDQVQESASSPADLMTKGQSVTLCNQTPTLYTTSEDHTLKPGCVHQSPVSVVGSSASLTYAGVLGRASPSPPPPAYSPEQQKYKEVEQPLPKIFQRDRTPPREADVPSVQCERKATELFRRPSKTQRTRSRKFLQELKELSQNGGDGVWCGSPSSSSTPDLSQSPDDLLSPPSSPRVVPALSVSSPRCAPSTASSSPQAIPIPIPTASPGLLESPGSRARSSSESSAASLDIEFVEQDEVDWAAPTKGRGGLGGRNGFLACILGSGDSDSESEDDSDLDWDEVCDEEVAAPGLDDSWETFGFGLVVVECRVTPTQGQDTPCPAEAPKCEESGAGGDTFLRDVNKRWEEAVQKDVQGRSAPRVKFGGEKVHPMVVWGHAYREARRGPWEQQARDRARFAQRVASMESTLSQVLDPGHRRAVYRRLHAPRTPRCFL